MKKNRFLAFILSLIPGCGLMYLGYMKKGLQTMLMFVAAGYLAYFTNTIFFDWLTVLFLMPLPVLWFYQMFDAMHSLTRMRRDEIETPGDDGFFFPENLFAITPIKNRTFAKAAAVALILTGAIGIVYGALNNLHYVLGWDAQRIILGAARGYVVPALASLALIIAGVRLLKGQSRNSKTHDLRDGRSGETV